MSNPRSTAQIAGHPIHPMLIPFPIAFFVGTLAADIAYWNSGDVFWFTMTEWLLGAGVVMALLAAVMGLTDFLGDARIRALNIAWWHMIGNVSIVLLEAVNWYTRYANGPDAIVPTGFILSLVATGGLLVTGWLGGELAYVKRVGIAEDAPTVEQERYRRAA